MTASLVRSVRRAVAVVLVVALLPQIAPPRSVAAPGDFIADVVVSEPYPQNVAPSVAFDGTYLYHTGYGGSVLHRIDVPPAGGPHPATGQVDVTIVGASSGIMTLSYDAGRDAFWAVGGDGTSIYLLSKTGAAALQFVIDPANDRPQFQAGPFATEAKIAYDRTDDTIWYSPDATVRIYHYHTAADALGTAQLVSATPFINVGLAPNDMTPQCGYSQSSGVAVGGANLFVTAAGCSYYFEYTKTGQKVAYYAYNLTGQFNTQDLECDSRSYGVGVFWVRDGYNGHIRAFEQPGADACVFGGGTPAAPAPSGFPVVRALVPSSFPLHANSHAVAMPGTVESGDLLVALFTNHAWAAVTTPSGWTLLGTTVNGTQVRTSRFAKRADGTEGGTTVDFKTSIQETAVAHVYRIAAWFDDGNLANAVADAAVVGRSTTPDPPALDPVAWDVANTLWIAAYGAQNLGQTFAYPTAYTNGRYDESGGIVGRTSTASARRDLATPVADPGSFSNQALQSWVAVTIGIRGAP